MHEEDVCMDILFSKHAGIWHDRMLHLESSNGRRRWEGGGMRCLNTGTIYAKYVYFL